MRISSILHNKFKLHFINVSFLILSFLKKLINNAFEYHRENRMSSEFYHTIHSDCIEFEQKFMTAFVSLAVEKLQLMHECACNHAISQFLAMK